MTYSIVSSYIRRNSGIEQDVQDTFGGAIEILLNMIVDNAWMLESVDIGAYLIGICKYQWLKTLRERKKFPVSELPPDDIGIIDPNGYTEDDERKLDARQRIAQECREKLTERCKAILQYFYFDEFSMEEIARKMNFANERVAITAKSRCMETLRRCCKPIGNKEERYDN